MNRFILQRQVFEEEQTMDTLLELMGSPQVVKKSRIEKDVMIRRQMDEKVQ